MSRVWFLCSGEARCIIHVIMHSLDTVITGSSNSACIPHRKTKPAYMLISASPGAGVNVIIIPKSCICFVHRPVLIERHYNPDHCLDSFELEEGKGWRFKNPSLRNFFNDGEAGRLQRAGSFDNQRFFDKSVVFLDWVFAALPISENPDVAQLLNTYSAPYKGLRG